MDAAYSNDNRSAFERVRGACCVPCAVADLRYAAAFVPETFAQGYKVQQASFYNARHTACGKCGSVSFAQPL